jgi:DNA-directed RNA polymerase subunit beta'
VSFELIDATMYRLSGQKETVLLADRMRTLGYTNATKRGHLDRHRRHGDPARRSKMVDAAQSRWPTSSQYAEGLITDGERYNKVIDIWASVTEQVTKR